MLPSTFIFWTIIYSHVIFSFYILYWRIIHNINILVYINIYIDIYIDINIYVNIYLFIHLFYFDILLLLTVLLHYHDDINQYVFSLSSSFPHILIVNKNFIHLHCIVYSLIYEPIYLVLFLFYYLSIILFFNLLIYHGFHLISVGSFWLYLRI